MEKAKEERVALLTENDLEIAINEAFKLFRPRVRDSATRAGFKDFSPSVKFFLLREGLVYNNGQAQEPPTREDLEKYGELKNKVSALVDNPREYEKVNSYIIKVLGI